MACGNQHTLILTQKGCCFAFGDNSKGQVGTGSSSTIKLPTLVESLPKAVKVRAGEFSAALTVENELYYWGTGAFGSFPKPQSMGPQERLLDF